MSFEDGFDKIEPTNAYLRAGIEVHKNFDIGFEYNFSISSDSIDGIDFDVDTTLIFVKGKYPVSEKVELYALAGYANSEVTGSSAGLSVSADDDDFAYGIGVQFLAGEEVYVSAEYIKYYDDQDRGFDLEVDSFNIGLAKYF